MSLFEILPVHSQRLAIWCWIQRPPEEQYPQSSSREQRCKSSSNQHCTWSVKIHVQKTGSNIEKGRFFVIKKIWFLKIKIATYYYSGYYRDIPSFIAYQLGIKFTKSINVINVHILEMARIISRIPRRPITVVYSSRFR